MVSGRSVYRWLHHVERGRSAQNGSHSGAWLPHLHVPGVRGGPLGSCSCIDILCSLSALVLNAHVARSFSRVLGTAPDASGVRSVMRSISCRGCRSAYDRGNVTVSRTQAGGLRSAAMTKWPRIYRTLALLLVIPVPVLAHDTPLSAPGGPLTGPPVLDAPFTASALTSVTWIRDDGTRLTESGSARYYRDRSGRVRVEQVVGRSDPVTAAKVHTSLITIDPDPNDGSIYTLDPRTKTAHIGLRSIAGIAIGGGETFALPIGNARVRVLRRANPGDASRGLILDGEFTEESLGTRTIEGVLTHGRRLTVTLLAGQLGSTYPAEVVDERWESAELGLLIYSRYSDSRIGIVEYSLTNIRRVEPMPELFGLPATYRLFDSTADDPVITIEPWSKRDGSKTRPK